MSAQRFTAKLIEDDKTSGCGIQLPFSPKEVYGRARAPVKVTINDYTFRTTTCPMSGAFWIPVNRSNREGAGVAAGEKVKVMIALDEDPRVVQPPADFVRALRASPPAFKAWQELGYSHQKAYVGAIEEAKKAETRQRRIAEAVRMLHPGKHS